MLLTAAKPTIPVIHSTTTLAVIQAQGKVSVAAPPPLLQTQGQLFPEMLTEVKVVNAAIGGTTGAKLVEDKQGRKFVQKSTEKIKPPHLRAEYHTNKAYKVLAVQVPEVMLYHKATSKQVKEGMEASTGDQPVMLSKFVPGNTVELRTYLRDGPAI